MLKAITIKPPWVNLIADGHKTIETRRRWHYSHRGEIAIHASRPVGAIVALANLDDVIICGREHERAAWCVCAGEFGLVLSNVRKLPEPIHCRGMLGVWTVPKVIEAAVQAAGCPPPCEH